MSQQRIQVRVSYWQFLEASMTKQDMIKRMIELQQKFIEQEHQGNVSPGEYFVPAGGFLSDFKKEYEELATKVIDLAHAEKGSARV